MSSFSEVKQATCQILKDDGITLSGTGFFILPAGYILTCHHVIFGLKKLLVKTSNDQKLHQAEYLKKFSNPIADFAVLKLYDVSTGALQLGRMREGCEVYGYGFRPTKISIEPKGHTFAGRLEPGQELRLSVSPDLKDQLEEIPLDQRQPWNNLSEEFRISNVRTFICAGDLEQGVSGGPVYDKQLRRVVGIFRAIEEKSFSPSNIAYIIPMDEIFAHWPDLEKENSKQMPDTIQDCLKRDFDIHSVSEGGKPIYPLLRQRFESIFSFHRIYGRNRELTLLNRFVHTEISGYFFVTGPAGFGKTALLSNWARSLESKDVLTAFHFIDPMIDTSIYFCLKNICEQLLEFHNLGGDIPQDENKLQGLFNTLLKKSPPPNKSIVIILDGLDEANYWPDLSYIVPPILPEGIFFVISMRDSEIDEIEYLKERLKCTNHLLLPVLSTNDIFDWIQCSDNNLLKNLPKEDKFIALLAEKTEGFPLYLHYLIDEITNSSIENIYSILEQSPRGFSRYVREQFRRLAKEENVDNKTFQELFALLSIAHSALSENDIIGIIGITKWDLQKLPWSLKRWFNIISANTPSLYSFSHPLLAHEFKRELGDESQKALNKLLDYCSRFQEHKSPYAFHHFTEHLLETQQYEKLFSLVENEKFWDILFETFSEDLLQTLSKNFHFILRAAIETDNAGYIAELLILHAMWLRDAEISPSDALSNGNLQLAWELAELYDYDICVLWYLFLIWELKNTGKQKEAVTTLNRLLEKYSPRQSHKFGWEEYAAALLVHVFEISEEAFYRLQRGFFTDYGRRILCYYLSSNEHFFVAKKIVLEIRDLNCKVNALILIGNAQIQARKIKDAIISLNSAMNLSRGFEDQGEREKIQVSIKEAQAKAYAFSSNIKSAKPLSYWEHFWEQLEEEVLNNFNSTINKAKRIKDRDDRIKILAFIAKVQSTKGEKRFADKAFCTAIEYAQLIPEDDFYSKVLTHEIKSGSLKTIVRSISERSVALDYIAQVQTNVEDFESALETSSKIEDIEIRLKTQAYIVKKLADKGDFTSATKISKIIKDDIVKEIKEAVETNFSVEDDPLERATNVFSPVSRSIRNMLSFYLEALASIAVNQAKNGENELAEDTFYEAIYVAQTISGGLWLLDLKPIIRAMAKTNVFVLDIISSYKKIKVEGLKDKILMEIAERQAKLGNFKLAVDIVNNVNEKNKKVRLLALIAEELINDKREARIILKKAQEISQSIEEKEKKAANLTIVAKAAARIKETKLAKKLFENALETALSIDDSLWMLPSESYIEHYEEQFDVYTSSAKISKAIEKNSKRWDTLKAISRAQAEVGYFISAIVTANKIEYCLKKEEALEIISIEQVKSGNVASAFETVNIMTDSAPRYHALNSIIEELIDLHDLEYAIKNIEQIGAKRTSDLLVYIVKAYIKLGDLNSGYCTSMKIEDTWKKDEALKYIAKEKAETGDYISAFTIIQKFENDYAYNEALEFIAKAQAKANDFTSALETVKGTTNKHKLYRHNALEFIAVAQAKVGDYISAKDTAGQFKDIPKQVKVLVAIAKEQVSKDRAIEAKLTLDEGLNLTLEIQDDHERSEALISIINVKVGNDNRILKIAETIQNYRGEHLSDIAEALTVIEDLDNFKKLIIPCSYYMESAISMCGFLTQLYPNQLQTILEVIKDSEF